MPPAPHPGVHAYVDGSHWDNVTTFGVVVIRDDEIIKEISKAIPPDREGTGARQIIGELWGAMAATQWMVKNRIAEFTLHFDYSGIRFWASERWQARQAYAKEYVAFMINAPVKIRWNKIKGHSKNLYNDRAHDLAKMARLAIVG